MMFGKCYISRVSVVSPHAFMNLTLPPAQPHQRVFINVGPTPLHPQRKNTKHAAVLRGMCVVFFLFDAGGEGSYTVCLNRLVSAGERLVTSGMGRSATAPPRGLGYSLRLAPKDLDGHESCGCSLAMCWRMFFSLHCYM